MKGNLDVKKYFDNFDFRILIPPESIYPTRERSVFQEIIQCCGNQLISHSVSFGLCDKITHFHGRTLVICYRKNKSWFFPTRRILESAAKRLKLKPLFA